MEWSAADIATVAAVNGAFLVAWLLPFGVTRLIQFFTRNA